MSDLKNEWAILHNTIEQYEQYSLIIKLCCVLMVLLAILTRLHIVISLMVVLIVWLQDGVWTTFQRRLEARILVVESEIEKNPKKSDRAYQLYSQWSEQRSGVAGTIKEYVKNSLKPTVSYPYIILVILLQNAYLWVY